LEIVIFSVKIIVILGLLNVWLLRFSRSTAYRGGNAKSLKEEFAVYGLPDWFMYVVGTLKIGAALALLIGFWVPALIGPAAVLIVLLMLGALAMHFKIKDPMIKSMPAALILAMGLFISIISLA
jgi:uncharacterized membrane protein YphA (DoxX/SURF4 family)